MHFEDPPDLGVSGVRKDLSFSFRADSEILKNRRLEKATLRVVFFLLLSEIRTAEKKLLARHRNLRARATCEEMRKPAAQLTVH